MGRPNERQRQALAYTNWDLCTWGYYEGEEYGPSERAKQTDDTIPKVIAEDSFETLLDFGGIPPWERPSKDQ